MQYNTHCSDICGKNGDRNLTGSQGQNNEFLARGSHGIERDDRCWYFALVKIRVSVNVIGTYLGNTELEFTAIGCSYPELHSKYVGNLLDHVTPWAVCKCFCRGVR